MEVKSVIFILSVFFGLVATEVQQKRHCQYMLYNCTQVVRPFLNDDRYMFPTSHRDINNMCKMWSGFVDCVRHFMTDCSSDDQRSKFNNAVGDSMDTVHAICSSDKYQTEYLANAVCFKRVSIGSCDSYYRRMVDQVSNQQAENNHICCAYSQFKNCVTEPLMKQCGNRTKAFLDHSMTFLGSMCGKTHYGLSYRCPTAPPATKLPIIASFPTENPRVRTTEPSVTRWTQRTIIYTLPPTQQSRTSNKGCICSDIVCYFSTWVALVLLMLVQ